MCELKRDNIICQFLIRSNKLLIRTGECNKCGECCKTLNITVVRDVTLSQHKSIKELELYLSYRGICLVGEDTARNQLFYSINIRYPIEPDNSEECSYQFQPSTPLNSIEFDIARTK